jgi:hypothetical protein
MKKSDLKTGMWVELRNGRKGMVLLNTNDGDIVSSTETWFPISDHWKEDFSSSISRNYDTEIVKIYQPRNNMGYFNHKVAEMTLVWERELEPIEMTLEEACKKLRDTMGKPVKITI